MAAANRIVSLISSATEILYGIGLGDRVVGISHECDYPPEIDGKPRLTRSLVDSAAASVAIDQQVRAIAATQSALYTIDVDQLTALEPELIITQAQCDVCAVRYEDVAAAVRGSAGLNATTILALNPASIWDVLDDVERIAQAVGEPAVIARAAKFKTQLRARVESVAGETRNLSDDARPRVICLEWIEPPMAAGNWMPELVSIAGGKSGLSRAGVHSPCVEWSRVVDYDPQVLVIMPCGFDLERAIAEAHVLPLWPGWSGLSAVREDRVYAADGNAYFNRSGPRLVESVEILAHLFHPNLVDPPRDAARKSRRLTTRDRSLIGA